MRRMRTVDRPLMAWMANSENSLKWCITNKLEGVITNDPRHLLELCHAPDVEKVIDLGFAQWFIGLSIYILAGLYGLFVFERRTQRRNHVEVESLR